MVRTVGENCIRSRKKERVGFVYRRRRRISRKLRAQAWRVHMTPEMIYIQTAPVESFFSRTRIGSYLAHVRIGVKLPAYSSEMNVAVLVWLDRT